MARVETDLLGSLELPDDVLYGIQTERARSNFCAADRPVRRELIHALAQVKAAAAMANADGGYLDPDIACVIISACSEVMEGQHDVYFVVDALQGGAGTSTNMNLNEVIAHVASRRSGRTVDPLDHVNLHQSTNDVFPTALRIAAIHTLTPLEYSILALQHAYQTKEREFADVVKLGRTELRDAVPLTLGREFGAVANALSRDRWRVGKCAERLRVVNIGGTAIGTGLTAPRDYIFMVIEKLRNVTGLPLSRAENLIDATQNQDALAEVSGILSAYATNLIKFSRDLRLLSSGPVGGLGEIELPALQPGSSIMPGKINPVIPEMAIQAAYRALGCHHMILLSVMSGELELNAFMPLAADALLEQIQLLTNAGNGLAQKCVNGMAANVQHCRALAERSREIVTALLPYIGHETAIHVAHYMTQHNASVREALDALKITLPQSLDVLLTAQNLCALGSVTAQKG